MIKPSFTEMFIRELKPIAKLLGGVETELKKRTNREVWGIEIISQCAEKAKERLDRVMVGDIEIDDFDLPNDYFDCIICNDVLEHLKDPWSILSPSSAVCVYFGLKRAASAAER